MTSPPANSASGARRPLRSARPKRSVSEFPPLHWTLPSARPAYVGDIAREAVHVITRWSHACFEPGGRSGAGRTNLNEDGDQRRVSRGLGRRHGLRLA